MNKVFREVWTALGSRTRQQILRTIDDDIRDGLFVNFRNANAVHTAFLAGRLGGRDAMTYIARLSTHLSQAELNRIIKSLLKNKSFIKSLSGKSKEEFRTLLRDLRFNEGVIDSLETAWLDAGLTFRGGFKRIFPVDVIKKWNQLVISNPATFLSEFKKYLFTKLPNDPFSKAFRNLRSRKIPFSGWSKEEWKRLLMWIGTGQRLLPNEISAAFKRNGFIGVSGAWMGSVIRQWIKLSFYLSVANIIIQIIRDLGRPGNQYEAQGIIATAIARVLDDSIIVDFRYFIPILNIKTILDEWVNPLLSGDEETLVNNINDEMNQLTGQLEPKGEEDELLNILTDKQYSNVQRTQNGGLIYYDNDHPIRKINGIWCVYMPKQGWFDMRDIQ